MMTLTDTEIQHIVETELIRARRHWTREADASQDAHQISTYLGVAVDLANGLTAYLMSPMEEE